MAYPFSNARYATVKLLRRIEEGGVGGGHG